MLGGTLVRGPSGARVDITRPQVAAVLAMLWDEGRPVRRDELADLLWGDWNLPEHWSGAIRGVVTKARGVLEAAGFPREVLVSSGGLIRLELPADATTDLAEAEELVRLAGEALDAAEPERTSKLVERALSLLDRPLAITAEGDWPRRLHLRAETYQRQARRLEVRADLAMGRTTEAIAAANDLVTRDHLDEVAHELLISANLAGGRRAAAKKAHTELISVLERELGAEPSRHIAELVERAKPPEPLQPPSVRIGVGERFLGRRIELAALDDAYERVIETGTPGLIVVRGPAGIGKSRLVEEFLARGPGQSLWGRCRAEAAEPFEPIVDAFRVLLDADHAVGRARQAVLEALDTLVAQGPSSNAHGTRERRARANQQVVDTVTELCRAGPMVLVVDDLQWASGDSIALVQRLLETREVPLLVIATARDSVDQPGAMTELLRAAPTGVITLEALTVDDLDPLAGDLVDLVGRPMAVDALSSLLWQRTGGLPYYLSEIVRDANRRRRLEVEAIPEQVRAWVRNRVAALPGDQGSVIEVAAVIGLRPSVALVEATWIGPGPATLIGLEQLVRAGFLTETDHPDLLEFPHQITREVVVDEMGAARRARLHERVAGVLVDAGDDDPPHAQIAHHYAQAGPTHARDAARHAYLAGVASLTRGAWAQAEVQLTEALTVLSSTSTPLAAAILVALGWTRHALGDPADASSLLDQATDLAVELQLPHESARAALFLTGRAGRGAAHTMSDEERILRLTGALEAVTSWEIGDVDYDTALFPMTPGALAPLRTAVEVELAWAMLFTGSLDERTELLTGTLARARADAAGPSRLARALLAQRNILTGAGQLPQRLTVLEEVLALPRDRLPVDTVVSALLSQHEDLLSAGDRVGARAALDAAGRTVHLHAHPYWHWACATWESLWLLVNGDPDGAEAALVEAAAIQPWGSAEAAACWAVQLAAIRLAQQRAGEVVDALVASAAEHPEVPAYRAVLALAASLAGDRSTAEKAYGHFVADTISSVPTDSNRLLTLSVLGDVAADLGDEQGAAVLDGLLAPDDGVMVVLNCYGGGGSWWGPVARVRSRLAEVLGRPDDAEAARERARVSIDALGAATLGQPGL